MGGLRKYAAQAIPRQQARGNRGREVRRDDRAVAERALSDRAIAPPSTVLADGLDTFPKLLLHNAANWPDAVAMREKDLGIWNAYGWADYRDRVREIALGLLSLGFRRGEAACLIGRNRPNWVWSELATQALGGMSLGVYADALAEEAAYLIVHAGATVVLAEDEEQVDKLLELRDRIPTVRRIVFHDPRGMRKYDDPRVVHWDELVQRGAALGGVEPGRFEAEVAQGRGEDVAIQCTTSGTTAHPKLARLQHRPFLEHQAAYLAADPRGPEDEYV